MIDINELRQSLGAVQPEEVSELLDRLEAAEKDVALKERIIDALGSELNAVANERDTLRAKVEAMERQEPVAWQTFDGEGGYDYRNYADNENYQLEWNARNPNHAGWVEPLYLAPGAQAQPAPSIPEGWKLVPTAESRHPGIYKMLGALHAIDNTRGASEWESYAAMLAAAPEAKP